MKSRWDGYLCKMFCCTIFSLSFGLLLSRLQNRHSLGLKKKGCREQSSVLALGAQGFCDLLNGAS